jgi:uncharacterized protein with HEPN domain
MRSDRERLLDMLEAVQQIDKYTHRGQEIFEQDELIQIWVVHHLEILGEAASRVSQGLREKNSDIPWAEVIATRNVLIHAYFGIDTAEVWAVIEHDLPRLKLRLEEILNAI